MPKFVIVQWDFPDRTLLVEAENQDSAVGKAVDSGFAQDRHDMWYGIDDGQIAIIEVKKELS